jgi:hypothetical protein
METSFWRTCGVRTVERDGKTVIEVDHDTIIARHLRHLPKRMTVNPSLLCGACHLRHEPKFGDAIPCSDPLRKALPPKTAKRAARFPAILLNS